MTKNAPIKISMAKLASPHITVPKHVLSTVKISRISQEDFLSQLRDILARYDHDNDGLLSEEDWKQVARDLAWRDTP